MTKTFRFLSLFALLFIAGKLAAQTSIGGTEAPPEKEGLVFHKEAWAVSLKNAAAANKFILLDAYTDWCYWCKVMDKKTFPDPKVSQTIMEKFYPVRLEMEKEEDGRKVAMKYHVNSFPTFLILNPQGQLVYVSHGYEEPADYLATLEKALAASPDTYAAINKTGLEPGFPDFYINSFDKTSKVKTEEKKVVDFLQAQSSKTSELAWGVMWRFRSMPGCGDILLQNAEGLKGIYGKDEVEDAVSSVLFSRAGEAGQTGDEKKLTATLEMVDKYLTSHQDEYKMTMQMTFYSNQKRWREYADLIGNYVEKKGYAGNENTVNTAAWTLYEKCKDKPQLEKAAGWMENVIKSKPEYMYLDTYAALLYATGKYKDAETYANKAIDAGKAAGEDVKETVNLLQMIRAKQ